MKDTANLDGVGSGADEEKPVVADAKSEFFHSLECLYVALARIREAMQGGENAHGGGLVQPADIGLGRFSPDDALHVGSLKRSISSWVIPSSARTCSWGIPGLCFSHCRASAIAFSSSAVSGSSSTGALAMARETGSSMASSRPTTAVTWRGARRSISSWACSLVSAIVIFFSVLT